MSSTALKNLPKVALAALFAAGSTTAIVANEAANPAASGAAGAGLLASTSAPAAAHGGRDRVHRHRHWHGGHWDGHHHWHPGFFINL